MPINSGSPSAGDSALSPRPTGTVKVFFASSSFPADYTDWKSVFIRHLVEALAARVDMEVIAWAPRGACLGRIEWATIESDVAFLSRLMDQGGLAHLLRNHRTRGLHMAAKFVRAMRAAAVRTPASIYHVNWLQNAIALPADGRPLLVSALGTDMQLLSNPLIRLLLRRVLRWRKVLIAPNADWMEGPLVEAFGDLAQVHVIPLGVDDRWFQITRAPSTEPTRWLTVTRLTEGKIGDLFNWCAPHFRGGRGRELHVFGPMQDAIALPDWVHYHGAATPDELAATWFPTATGLITLSYHSEGRPQVMLEAMASGLPIIASDITAHTDVLSHQETGFICGHEESLAEQLTALERPETNQRIGRNAQIAVRRQAGTWQDCAARYHAAYLQLLGNADA